MSMLADLEYVCKGQPMTSEQCARLFFDIIQNFNWEIDGVDSVETAEIYLFHRD